MSGKIIKLESNNVLRLDAVELTPEGNTVVIGGDNEQGKTSVLESISLAINGIDSKKTPEPLKRGAEKGSVVCELDDLLITRTFTKSGGGTLKVSNKKGANFSSPQSMLNKLTGKLTFDPLAWCGMDDKKQLDTLKEIVGLDFSKEDEKRLKLFNERTDVNRDGKNLKANVEAMPDGENGEKLVVTELMQELENRKKINKENDTARNYSGQISRDISNCSQDIDTLEKRIEEIAESLSVQKGHLEKANEHKDSLAKELIENDEKVSKLVDANENEILEKINKAEETNTLIKQFEDKFEAEKKLEKLREQSTKLTDSINKIDSDKTTKMSKAKFPIKGLSFSDDGVLYKGIPFKQSSSAEKLRVSVAMGLAMNPELKVLLIRDGSLLDEKNLKIVSEMAKEADAQIWIERVGKGKECHVIIEDGKIK